MLYIYSHKHFWLKKLKIIEEVLHELIYNKQNNKQTNKSLPQWRLKKKHLQTYALMIWIASAWIQKCQCGWYLVCLSQKTTNACLTCTECFCYKVTFITYYKWQNWTFQVIFYFTGNLYGSCRFPFSVSYICWNTMWILQKKERKRKKLKPWSEYFSIGDNLLVCPRAVLELKIEGAWAQYLLYFALEFCIIK